MLIDQIKKALKPSIPRESMPEAGLRHYEREVKGEPVRYHLRVDNDGSGLLIANAAAACRLSPTGVVIAEGLLEGEKDKVIQKRVARSFSGVDDATIAKDLERVRKTIDDMAFPGGRYPLLNLDDPGTSSRGRALAAPLAAEMGIDGTGDPSARIDKLWQVAVPQVVLIHLPGAPPEKLIEGVERAEDHGLIAGVRAPATDLLENDLLARLVRVGLDHVDVYWASADASRHDELFGAGDHDAARKVFRSCKEMEVCPVAVVPIVAGSLEGLEETIGSLRSMDVGAATLFALAQKEGTDPLGGLEPGALRQAAVTAEEVADRLHMNMIFAPPVERDPNQTLKEQLRRGPRAAGEAAIRITPDGSVIPPHGPRKSVGNILKEPFETIWNQDAFRHLREAVAEPDTCDQCPGLAACVGGCIANPDVWARIETSEEA